MSSGADGSLATVSPESESFICGTDSPVRLASLTTADPRSTRQSHGMGVSPAPGGLATEMISPGTSSSEDRFSHRPSRKTRIRVGVAPMPRSVRMFLMRENAVVASNMSKDAAENSAYFQYSSRSQSRVVNTWNTQTGDMSCSL